MSVNLIDGLSINRGKLTTVFLDFLIHPNIWRLWGQISPLSCQIGTIIILIPACNPSFHLWKPSKNLWALPYSRMPFKICNCDKFLCHLSRNSDCGRWLNQINLHFLALLSRWLIKKAKKCEKRSRVFGRNGKFTLREMHVGVKSIGKS